jgi:ribosomal protein L7/L12
MTPNEFVSEKPASGATIMETIKAVMIAYGMSLDEAKTFVSSHPAWLRTVRAVQPLYADLDRMTKHKTDNDQ